MIAKKIATVMVFGEENLERRRKGKGKERKGKGKKRKEKIKNYEL